MAITYRQLAEHLSRLNAEQLNQTAVVHDPALDEYLPIKGVSLTEETDVLDSGHAVLDLEE